MLQSVKVSRTILNSSFGEDLDPWDPQLPVNITERLQGLQHFLATL